MQSFITSLLGPTFYSMGDSDPSTTGSNALTALLKKIDIPAGIVLAALEALVVALWLRGKKKRAKA